MVVFVCGGCNESLKKNKIDNHLSRCKGSVKSVSCCDCGKEFADGGYKEHNVCVSEDQKYGPQSKDAQHTPNVPNLSKGQVKQENILQELKAAIKRCQPSGYLEIALNKLTEYPNIPRKQKKFEKFMENCVGVKSPNIVAEAWKVFESAMQECQSTVSSPSKPIKPEDDSKSEKVAAKRPLDDDSAQKESVKKEGDEATGCEESGEPQKKKKKNRSRKKKDHNNDHKDEEGKQNQVDNSMTESKDSTLKSGKRKRKGKANGINGDSKMNSPKKMAEENVVLGKRVGDNQNKKKDTASPQKKNVDKTKSTASPAKKKMIKKGLDSKVEAEHDPINSGGEGLPKKKKNKNKIKKANNLTAGE